MQTILSLDLSSTTAELVVANVEGKHIEIIESYSFDTGNRFLDLLNGSHSILPAGENQSADPQQEGENPIIEILSHVKSQWTNAVLTIPPADYLALNLELPFGDSRSINRIIDLEIQDLVPFEISDFHVSHKSIGAIENGAPATEHVNAKFDIHVGIISKIFFNKIMALCHKANFEPFIVTTPCAVLGAVKELAPLYFAENSAILLERLPDFYLITCFDGAIRGERIISNLKGDARDILLDLKLFISGSEKRYGRNVEKVYYFGKSFAAQDLQGSLARTVENLELKEFLPIESDNSQIALLGAVYGEENNSSLIISNLRARQHAYNQRIKYLLKGLKSLLPITGIFLLCWITYVAGTYLMQQYQISRLTNAINYQIVKALPGVEIPAGSELQTLQAENQKLEEQMNDISSLSSMTPLDLLLEVSKDLPSTLGVTIKAVKIKDNKIVLEGLAAKYSDVDNVRKILERNTVFQRVKKGDNPSFGAYSGMRPFSFEVWVKE